MATDSPTPRACLIGPGRAGGSLALAWQRAGVLAFDAVYARQTAHPLAERLGCASVTVFAEVAEVDVWVVAVPDSSIAEVATQLARERRSASDGVALHLSGALSSEALAPLREIGLAVASGHPLRSFPACDENLVFDGTWCGLEGDAEAVSLLEDWFSALGGHCIRIDGAAKTAYHGAAVLAGNTLVGLADAAIAGWRAAGLPEDTARAVFADLAGGVIQNVTTRGTAASLSGPLSRGDLDTVAAQLAELDARDPSAAAVYRALSLRLLTLLDGSDADRREAFETLLR